MAGQKISVCAANGASAVSQRAHRANLRELKTRGMTEAALGVDTQNLSGALRVYERMGFKPVEKFTTYRKEL